MIKAERRISKYRVHTFGDKQVIGWDRILVLG